MLNDLDYIAVDFLVSDIESTSTQVTVNEEVKEETYFCFINNMSKSLLKGS